MELINTGEMSFWPLLSTDISYFILCKDKRVHGDIQMFQLQLSSHRREKESYLLNNIFITKK